jgi:hypothetical protein
MKENDFCSRRSQNWPNRCVLRPEMEPLTGLLTDRYRYRPSKIQTGSISEFDYIVLFTHFLSNNISCKHSLLEHNFKALASLYTMHFSLRLETVNDNIRIGIRII